MKATKDDIIKSLLEESFIRSTGATSLKDIADKVGIKKASLYNHFESREDLVKQTFATCADYIQSITFTPTNIEAVAIKYAPEVVLKGIVNRYYKMHEKAPLFQIYTFVESQKYFCQEAIEILANQDKKILNQTKQIIKTLVSCGKLNIAEKHIDCVVTWFYSGMKNMLDEYLLKRKHLVMTNPASGEGELFALPSNEEGLEKIDEFIDNFVAMIR